MSTSIPSTCSSTQASSTKSVTERGKKRKIHSQDPDKTLLRNSCWHTCHYYQLIPRLQFAVNEQQLRLQCLNSLQNICALYDVPQEHSTVVGLKTIASAQQSSHTMLLTLFFILFNIDTTLKEQMLRSEPTAVQRKIGHFSMHIREQAIPKFMSSERHSIRQLCEECIDAWSNA